MQDLYRSLENFKDLKRANSAATLREFNDQKSPSSIKANLNIIDNSEKCQFNTSCVDQFYIAKQWISKEIKLLEASVNQETDKKIKQIQAEQNAKIKSIQQLHQNVNLNLQKLRETATNQNQTSEQLYKELEKIKTQFSQYLNSLRQDNLTNIFINDQNLKNSSRIISFMKTNEVEKSKNLEFECNKSSNKLFESNNKVSELANELIYQSNKKKTIKQKEGILENLRNQNGLFVSGWESTKRRLY